MSKQKQIKNYYTYIMHTYTGNSKLGVEKNLLKSTKKQKIS